MAERKLDGATGATGAQDPLAPLLSVAVPQEVEAHLPFEFDAGAVPDIQVELVDELRMPIVEPYYDGYVTYGSVVDGFIPMHAEDEHFEIALDGSIARLPRPSDGPLRVRTISCLLNFVLPMAFNLAGQTIYHGALVRRPDGSSLLLVGGSGAGKSTLSLAASRSPGWSVVSDDLVLIRRNESGRFFGGPLYRTGIRVVDDSLDAVLGPESGAGPNEAHWKNFVDPSHEGLRFDFGFHPIDAVVLLRRFSDTAHSIDAQRSSPGAALTTLLGQLMQAPALGRLAETTRFNVTADILEQAPCWDLAYPSDFTRIPEVLEALQALAE